MRILLVSHEYPPVGGGAATAAQALANSLCSLGHSVTVLTARSAKLGRFTVEAGVAVYRIRCARKRPEQSNVFEMATFIPAALFKLPSILSNHRPEALLIFFTLPSGPIGFVANLFFGRPYVVCLRGGDVPGLAPELNFVHKVVAPLRHLVFNRALAIVANSNGLRKRSEAIDRYPVQIIPNGVDTDVFYPAQSDIVPKTNRLRILFVGRFHDQKNLPLLFSQAAQLPPSAFELQLVGDGPERPRLERLAVQLAIDKAITWHGWVDRRGLPDLYRSADCLVNPSIYEGMPNVVLEAMACGLPVLASRVPGNDELVIEGETGFLFDLENPDALAKILQRLITDRDLGLRLGLKARARAVENFSWRSVAEDYLALFSTEEVSMGR